MHPRLQRSPTPGPSISSLDMAGKTQWWLWAWALVCAPALTYLSGQLELVTSHSPYTPSLYLLGIVVPGFALGSGVLAMAALPRSGSGMRLAVGSAYAIGLYTLTLMFDNVPVVTHAAIGPMR